MISAVEFGEKHRSCEMEWRRSLGPDATQADAYARCEIGEYLFWQLRKGLSPAQYDEIRPQVKQVLDVIAERAIRGVIDSGPAKLPPSGGRIGRKNGCRVRIDR